MYYLRSLFAGCLAFAMTTVVSGGSCLLEESFTGASGFTWFPWNTYGYIQPAVSGGTVYFGMPVPNFSGAAGRGGVSTSDWAIDLDHDFAFTVTWHNNAQNTNSGWARVNCVLKTYGVGNSELPQDGFSLSMTRSSSSEKRWRLFQNSSLLEYENASSSTSFQTSSFVYYSDSDELIVDGISISGLRAVAGQYVELAFSASNYWVASQAYDALHVSEVCFSSGGFAGALTGACCMTDSCVQGFASNCSGTFQGQGTSCSLLGACYDSDCAGDFTMDGIVDSDDVLAIVESWADSCLPCEGDGTISGVAGVGDLVVILRSWGTCG